NLITAAQARFLDAVAVHVRAIEAADVADGEQAALPVELGMPPRHGHVVEENVAVRVASDQRQITVQQKPAARVGSAADDEQGGSGGQGVDRCRVGQRLVGEFRL